MEENPANHLWCINLEIIGINYQPQLVSRISEPSNGSSSVEIAPNKHLAEAILGTCLLLNRHSTRCHSAPTPQCLRKILRASPHCNGEIPNKQLGCDPVAKPHFPRLFCRFSCENVSFWNTDDKRKFLLLQMRVQEHPLVTPKWLFSLTTKWVP